MNSGDLENAESDYTCDDGAPWTEDVVRNLVQLYREQPALWNQECPSYVSYCDRRLAYESIQEQLSNSGVSVLQVIAKIHEVRTRYVEELKNIAKAEMAGSEYESQFVWFYDMDNFLHPYLHVDEIEALEDIENVNDGWYGSSYYAEDERTAAVVRSRSMGEFCRSAGSLKHSCTASLPSFRNTTRSAPAKNCGALNCPANARPAGSAKSSAASPPRTPSDPDGRAVAIVRSSSQPIKMSEGVTAESSSGSRLTARKSCDEFDLFAKGVACRLKRMSPDAAARAQTEIQRVLTNAARDMEPNESRGGSSNLDLDSLKNCNCPVVSILSHSESRVCDGEESQESVNAI